MVKTLPDRLKSVLDDMIKAVNFIKANALNSRLFTELGKKSDSDFVTLLLHSHVRWLSKGIVLKQIFILPKEIKDFLQGSRPEMHQKFSDDCFLTCHIWLTFLNPFILSIWLYKEKVLTCFIFMTNCRLST